MGSRALTKAPIFAIAVIAAVGAAASAGTYARAGAAESFERFVQPLVKTFTGNSPGPIVQTTNNGTGTSLQGTSVKGNGIVGQTKLNNGGFSGKIGVLGQDLGTTGAQGNAGVQGTSTEGSGVVGVSSSGAGVAGVSQTLNGVNGNSNSGDGVVGVSNQLTGVAASGVIGVDAQGGSGSAIRAFGGGGDIFEGYDQHSVFITQLNDTGVFRTNSVVGGGCTTCTRGIEGDGTVTGVFGYASTNVSGGGAVVGQAASGSVFNGFNSSSQVFSVDGSGNVRISGLIYTGGGCASGCAKTVDGPGRHVVSYTPAESEPTTEDFGEGQLRGGAASVAVAADFANTIDGSAGYMVFITPEGDNRGLYVTDKTSRGFAVRESQGGHSTLAFSYRIVAKRYGVAMKRLPTIDVPSASRLNAMRSLRPSTLGHVAQRPVLTVEPHHHP